MNMPFFSDNISFTMMCFILVYLNFERPQSKWVLIYWSVAVWSAAYCTFLHRKCLQGHFPLYFRFYRTSLACYQHCWQWEIVGNGVLHCQQWRFLPFIVDNEGKKGKTKKQQCWKWEIVGNKIKHVRSFLLLE